MNRPPPPHPERTFGMGFRQLDCPPMVVVAAAIVCALAIMAGCGINKSRLATGQLVVSDAVDRAVAAIDFSPLSGRKVFFDTKYLDEGKSGPHGNVAYVISSLRQQMAAYDCRLQEKAENADFIVEARVGVLANDEHEVTFGIPGSAAATTAAVLLSGPTVPAPGMPELSVGRRNHQQGTAKIGVFAYDRTTREPVWQSGLAKSTSRARDYWIFGLGPFEKRSTITAGGATQVASEPGQAGVLNHRENSLAAYASPVVFRRALAQPNSRPEINSAVQPASYSEPAPLPSATPAPKPISQP